MVAVSVARRLGSEVRVLAYCAARFKPSGAAKRRPGSAKLKMPGERMEYRQFGRTDLKVSAIGFGCWEISGTYGPIDGAEFDRAVGRALDAGIDCFDTAEAYGMGISEQALARALGARRRDVCLVTKVG